RRCSGGFAFRLKSRTGPNGLSPSRGAARPSLEHDLVRGGVSDLGNSAPKASPHRTKRELSPCSCGTRRDTLISKQWRRAMQGATKSVDCLRTPPYLVLETRVWKRCHES